MSGSASSRSARRVQPASARAVWWRWRTARASVVVSWPTAEPMMPGRASCWAISPIADWICPGSAWAEAGAESGALEVVLQRFAGVGGVPVAAQCDVEGGQRPAEVLGEGEAHGQDDALEVAARRAGQVDADRQDPALGPGVLAPLGGAVFGVGEGCLQLARQGGLADAADAVEDEQVVAGRFEVLDVEAGLADVLQVVGERGRDRSPLGLPVGERLVGAQLPVVRAEQCPQVAACHDYPR